MRKSTSAERLGSSATIASRTSWASAVKAVASPAKHARACRLRRRTFDTPMVALRSVAHRLLPLPPPKAARRAALQALRDFGRGPATRQALGVRGIPALFARWSPGPAASTDLDATPMEFRTALRLGQPRRWWQDRPISRTANPRTEATVRFPNLCPCCARKRPRSSSLAAIGVHLYTV